MPNGYHGTLGQWKLLEGPLVQLDETLTRFAEQHGLRLSSNNHNWPERSLVWFAGDVRKLIQVFLESEVQRTFTFWICASCDRAGKRTWKHKTLVKASPAEEITAKLASLLPEAKRILDSWGTSELEPAP